ncbi:Murein DD-endopeptidase MepM and murein hydrolase activator NlpD, contain LysM domain [Seinonella peptonophila]|uniref:Murein DD-endopeptidase MepM and murein hydrolase activator NlpD, contain LysM domain n=1 Tax=Seinonella peptonophila TaxID=112248 RepID=A0A1M4WKZ5_9BACL|nr:M23 family metallopeptidase [Seinonella peptonophila]SHE81875.1 Murein DD-endopeptidase MepM and murein hydrolase activator NlpD, contain LysM domain [Seinonella peptonophila]
MWKKCIVLILILSIQSITINTSFGAELESEQLLRKIALKTKTPWSYLAAVYRFEQNRFKRAKQKNQSPTLHISNEQWAGLWNPNLQDSNPDTIRYFQGIGRDGDGDQKAGRNNFLDQLYSVARFLGSQGTSDDHIRHQLWLFYQHPVTVDVITHMAKVFQKFGSTKLTTNRFPLSLQSHYSYRDNWGASRGFGGRRSHEGNDIFADYGTPVLSTCYGYVELIGWNRFGGWRIGIRDTENRYHYFAHLGKFSSKITKGTIVKPGDQLGVVGSSGYGPPGTSGKFPPHLHYGIYRFTGKTTYAFDPFPLLKKWELKEKKKLSHLD